MLIAKGTSPAREGAAGHSRQKKIPTSMPRQTRSTIRLMRSICCGSARTLCRQTSGVFVLVSTTNSNLIGLPSAMGLAKRFHLPTRGDNRHI